MLYWAFLVEVVIWDWIKKELKEDKHCLNAVDFKHSQLLAYTILKNPNKLKSLNLVKTLEENLNEYVEKLQIDSKNLEKVSVEKKSLILY